MPRALIQCVAGVLLTAAFAVAHAPHDVVRVLALSPSYDRDGTIFASILLTNHELFARSMDGGRTWQQFAHPMVLDEITSFAFSPAFQRDGVAFAGTRHGGAWKTSDRGMSWTQVLPGVRVRDLSVSPHRPWNGHVLAATDLGAFGSTDSGQTWDAFDSGLTESDLGVVAHGTEPGVVYAGSRVLHRSSNGGRDWVPLSNLGVRMVSLAVAPVSSRDGATETLAVSFGPNSPDGQSNPVGVWISGDGGLAFEPANDGLTDLSVNDVSFADDGSMFAATRWHGPFHASGAHQPWSLSTEGLDPKTSQTDNHYRNIVPAPDFAANRTVVLGSFEGIYVSTDGGELWSQRELYGVQVLRKLFFSPGYADDGTIYVGSYGGGLMRAVLDPDDRSTTPGVNWTTLGTGLESTFSGAARLSPSYISDDTIYYGYTEVYRSENQGEDWTKLPHPGLQLIAARDFAISPGLATDRIVYVGGGKGSFRSNTEGLQWSQMYGGLPGQVRTTAIQLSPDYVNDATIFNASDMGVHRSTNGGQTWTFQGLDQDEVRALVVSPDFPSDATLFAAVNWAGVFRSTDAGDTWTPISAGLGPEPITEALALSPAFGSDRTVFAALGTGEVFRSTDAGDTWHSVSDGLPATTTRALAVSPDFATDRTVMVTNHEWIFRSVDAGESWHRLPGFIRTDDVHQSIRYSGGWGGSGLVPFGGGPDFGTATRQSNSEGAWMKYTFYGDSITWFAPKGPEITGIAAVEVDGRDQGTVELWSPGNQHQQVVFQKSFRQAGWHTIRITNTGDFSVGEPNTWPGPIVRSDGFGVTF